MCNATALRYFHLKEFPPLHQRQKIIRANFFTSINLGKSVENYKCQDYEELIHLFLFPVWIRVNARCERYPTKDIV